jgi:hypothetical protein
MTWHIGTYVEVSEGIATLLHGALDLLNSDVPIHTWIDFVIPQV